MHLFLIALSLNGQKIQTFTIERWEDAKWNNWQKGTYSYDENDFLSHHLYQNWNKVTLSWKDYSQSTFSNTVEGKIDESEFQMWDTVVAGWVNTSKEKYSYHVSGKPSVQISQQWGADVWHDFFKRESSYDENNYLINELTRIWDTSKIEWKKSTQVEYVNNTDGTINEYTTQYWSELNASWVISGRATYSYKNPEKPTMIVWQSYINEKWIYNLKINYNYDANGFLIHSQSEIWDEIEGKWVLKDQSNTVNNNDGTIQETINQSWDANKNAWVNTARYTYRYETTVGFELLNKKCLKLYPNPTQGNFTVDLVGFDGNSFVNIINTQGQVVKKIKTHQNRLFFIFENQIPGLYIIEVINNGKRYVRKFQSLN